MPITRELTPEELQSLEDKGIDSSTYKGKQVTLATDDELAAQQPSSPSVTRQPISGLGAAEATAKAHAGGYVGGGAGVLGTGALLAEIFGAPETLGGSLLAIPPTLAAAYGGSYLGQKAQDKLQGEDTTAKLEQEAKEAQIAHPLISGATDIGASALLSGGKPSLRNIFAAIGGDKEAIAKIAMNALVNPAINTGMDVALGNGLPSGRDLISQVAGGALFSEPNFLGRLGHRTEGLQDTTPPSVEGEPTAQQERPLSPFLQNNPEADDYISDKRVRDAFGKIINPKPKLDNLNVPDQYIAKTKYDALNRTPIDQMREMLHQKFMESVQSQPEQAPEIKSTVSPPAEPTAKLTQLDLNEATKQPTLEQAPQTTNEKAEEAAKGVTIPQAQVANENPYDIDEARVESPKQPNEKSEGEKDEDEATKMLLRRAVEGGEPSGTTDDIQKYSALKDIFKQHVQNGDLDKTKFVWDEMEKLKNKYGGMPPYKTGDKVESPEDIKVQKSEGFEFHGNYKITLPDGTIKYMYRDKDTMGGWRESDGKYKSGEILGWTKKEALDKLSKLYSPKQTTLGYDTSTPLEEHLRNDKATTGSVLAHIVAKQNNWSDLAEQMLKNASPEKLQDRVYVHSGNETSHYMPEQNYSSIHLNHLTDNGVILHEMGHSVLLNNIPKELMTLKGIPLEQAYDKYLANPSANDNIKELIQIHKEILNKIGIPKGENSLGSSRDISAKYGKYVGDNNAYAVGNLGELTTMAWSDPQFQHTLNETKSSSGKSLWSRFTDAVRKIMGVSVKEGSLLERTLKVNETLAKESRPSYELDEEGRKMYTPKGVDEKEKHLGWLGNVTRSMISKIRDIPHPSAKLVADSFDRALTERDQRVGMTSNKLIDYAQRLGLSKSDEVQLRKVADYENLNHTKAPSSLFTSDKQKKFYQLERQVYDESGKYRIKNNEPVYRSGIPTMLRQDPLAHPTTPNPKVVQEYKNNTNPEEIARLDKVFLANASKYGKSPEEAQQQLEIFKKNVAGNIRDQGGNMQYYNAARREQGIPLPHEFTREGYLNNLEAYYNRQATDNTFYKNVEANPKVLAALGESKDAWNRPVNKDPNGAIIGNPAVKAQLQSFRGEAGEQTFHNEQAISAIASTIFIGSPALELHKAATNLFTTLDNYADNPVQFGRMLTAMVKNFHSGIEHAVENGVVKLTARSVSDALRTNTTFAERLQALAQGYRKISSLGMLTDKWSSGLMQAGLEAAMPDKIKSANKGNTTNQALLKRLDPSYTVGKTYSPAEQSKLASSLASYIHGTKDGRTMPAWMAQDTEFAGFFKLAHWSIAQTNRFISDVYNPALKGDYKPLLTSLFGSAIGGYMIKKLREELQGKKGQIPSLSEIANSSKGLAGNKSLVLYNLIAATQYAGFGGLLSQIAKYPMDFAYKNIPQGATFPLDEITGDLASTLSHVSSAIANDPHVNWLMLGQHMMAHILSTDFQLGRMTYNNMINNGLITGSLAEKKELGDKLGQLRRFNMVEGLPYDEQGAPNENPYMNLEQKKFKQTQDVGEAAKMLPGLISNIMTKYADNPDTMLSKIKALKENEYSTFPSIENLPLSFMKYMGFLNKEEGPEKAHEALIDFMKHKVVNEAKSSVVP